MNSIFNLTMIKKKQQIYGLQSEDDYLIVSSVSLKNGWSKIHNVISEFIFGLKTSSFIYDQF